jgi:hypothetical protein
MSLDDLFPGIALAKADHCVAIVFQTFSLHLVAALALRIVMIWTVYIDNGLARVVEKIGPCPTYLNEGLRRCRETESTRFEKIEPITFQIGLALA